MQPQSKKPQPKVAAAGLGGAIATVIVAVTAAFGVSVPGEVAAAVATVIAFAAGWLRPHPA